MAEQHVIPSQAVRFGRPASLVGIVTTPPTGVETRPETIVLLNAGVIHRVGPNRLYVLLAARLAAAGFRTLRFDMSGVGDSDFRRNEADLDASVISDIDDALMFLEERYGARGFVLSGICTGANHGLRFAARDSRVAGVIPIDPYAYRTPGFYLRRYGRRLLSARGWRNMLTGRNGFLTKLTGRASGEPDPSSAFVGIGGTVAPPPRVEREEMLDILQRLSARRVPLLQVFTRGNIRYNHAKQFWAAFPELSGVEGIRVEYFPEAGHTFGRYRDRVDLVELIARWLGSTPFRSDGARTVVSAP